MSKLSQLGSFDIVWNLPFWIDLKMSWLASQATTGCGQTSASWPRHSCVQLVILGFLWLQLIKMHILVSWIFSLDLGASSPRHANFVQLDHTKSWACLKSGEGVSKKCQQKIRDIWNLLTQQNQKPTKSTPCFFRLKSQQKRWTIGNGHDIYIYIYVTICDLNITTTQNDLSISAVPGIFQCLWGRPSRAPSFSRTSSRRSTPQMRPWPSEVPLAVRKWWNKRWL